MCGFSKEEDKQPREDVYYDAKVDPHGPYSCKIKSLKKKDKC